MTKVYDPEIICKGCRSDKVTSVCQICHNKLCKSCVQFLAAESFTYLDSVGADISHNYYCNFCYDLYVDAELKKYKTVLRRAKDLMVFMKFRKQIIPVLKQAREPVAINSFPDQDGAILRLAFKAAALGYNALVKVEVESMKIRNEAYQKTHWNVKGYPATVDSVRLVKFSKKA